ncbi:MAG: hypothetical protein IPK81_07880 [Rhodospirillales bacterium]|nr:MAG: hypothetical protein IPK81_07880 [Rhodospirillales bacterium]
MPDLSRRLILAALPAVVASRASAQSPLWTDVVPPDMAFRIEMPSPVERSVASATEPAHVGPRIAWQASLERQNFDFDHVDYKPEALAGRDSKEVARELGRGAVDKAFPRPKFHYLRDEAVTLEGWDGYALDIQGDDGQGVVMRTWLVGDRLYRLLATYGADMRSKGAALRFTDSFKVSRKR